MSVLDAYCRGNPYGDNIHDAVPNFNIIKKDWLQTRMIHVLYNDVNTSFRSDLEEFSKNTISLWEYNYLKKMKKKYLELIQNEKYKQYYSYIQIGIGYKILQNILTYKHSFLCQYCITKYNNKLSVILYMAHKNLIILPHDLIQVLCFWSTDFYLAELLLQSNAYPIIYSSVVKQLQELNQPYYKYINAFTHFINM